MNFKHFLELIGEHLLAGLIGAIIGVIISVIYLLKIWMPMNAHKVGLGIIAIFPIMLIMFSILGIFVGGITGIVILLILKFLRKNKRKY